VQPDEIAGAVLRLEAGSVRCDAGFAQQIQLFDPLLPLFVRFIHD